MAIRLFAISILSLCLVSCGILYRRVPAPPSPLSFENEMEGYASWYGKEYHGRKTSSGEIYDMYAFTAAHRTLPLGSEIRVTNLENGKEVDVRINDRGPFVENRIIDLSYGSAKRIDMVNAGVAKVRLNFLKQPAAAVTSGYIIQAGSFLLYENALQLKGDLEKMCSPVYIETFETNTGKYHRVRIGPVKDKDSGLEIISKLKKRNINSYLIGAD